MPDPLQTLASEGSYFDHAAHAARSIRSLLPLYRDTLGGRYFAGGDNVRVGYRGVQLDLPTGGRIELIEPLPGSDFLDAFFGRHPRGGLHHLTFVVPDLAAMLAKAEAEGYEVIGRFDGEERSEAFIHPRSAHGVLVQFVWKSEVYRPFGYGGTIDEVLAAPAATEGSVR